MNDDAKLLSVRDEQINVDNISELVKHTASLLLSDIEMYHQDAGKKVPPELKAVQEIFQQEQLSDLEAIDKAVEKIEANLAANLSTGLD